MKTLLNIGRRCPFCGAVTIVTVDEDGLNAYNEGALVQKAFPDMSATEREVLISGICPKCQDDIFG